MTNLNIIGNGFDLYHGLPTSYYYFACYFLKNYEDTYSEFASMYGITQGVSNGYPSDELIPGIDDVGFWSDFEKNLGFLESDWVENSLLDDLGLEFSETIDKDEVYEIVDRYLKTNKVIFEEDDYYISFNYTHTLEKLYGKEDVFHIHGECGDDSDELIIGHGNDKAISRLRSKIRDLDEDAQFYQAANNRVQEYSFEKDILESLKKPVDMCKSTLRNKLLYYTKPDFIRVYGCSLGEVDIPYMKMIHEKWPAVEWSFSYYSKRDKERINEAAKEIGLKKSQWTLFKFENVLSSDIKKEIISKERITTYPTIDELVKKRAKES